MTTEKMDLDDIPSTHSIIFNMEESLEENAGYQQKLGDGNVNREEEHAREAVRRVELKIVSLKCDKRQCQPSEVKKIRAKRILLKQHARYMVEALRCCRKFQNHVTGGKGVEEEAAIELAGALCSLLSFSTRRCDELINLDLDSAINKARSENVKTGTMGYFTQKHWTTMNAAAWTMYPVACVGVLPLLLPFCLIVGCYSSAIDNRTALNQTSKKLCSGSLKRRGQVTSMANRLQIGALPRDVSQLHWSEALCASVTCPTPQCGDLDDMSCLQMEEKAIKEDMKKVKQTIQWLKLARVEMKNVSNLQAQDLRKRAKAKKVILYHHERYLQILLDVTKDASNYLKRHEATMNTLVNHRELLTALSASHELSQRLITIPLKECPLVVKKMNYFTDSYGRWMQAHYDGYEKALNSFGVGLAVVLLNPGIALLCKEKTTFNRSADYQGVRQLNKISKGMKTSKDGQRMVKAGLSKRTL
ncbi:hypothetical protein PROFUN_12358 [Planoprotostelium fungivorum]|uniref:Uncharacterized protein n=1 Tax=Planoprotostelium fungivorum TaxID=1890364 RepID=A0A2P6N9H0_9EUKA|nr:hypothetical protein PROFUN_12358 [Planoprotostelium fungivorum]